MLLVLAWLLCLVTSIIITIFVIALAIWMFEKEDINPIILLTILIVISVISWWGTWATWVLGAGAVIS